MDIEFLISELGSKNRDRRWKASEELARIGDKAVDHLLEALKSSNVDLRVGAAITLGKIGTNKAIQPLMDALKDAEWEVRWASATSLGNLKAREAVDGLIALLRDEFWEVRRAAAIALGKVKDPKAIEPLAEALKSELMIRFEAARSLIQLGSDAVESLSHLLSDDDPDVRIKAAEALGLIGDESASEALATCLNDADAGVREAAAKALVKLGGRGFEFLLSNLASERRTLEALKALDFVENKDLEKFLPVLREILEEGDEDARYETVTILGRLEEGGLELLTRALKDESEVVRRGAAMGILMMAEKALPFLEKAAESGDELAKELIEKIRK